MGLRPPARSAPGTPPFRSDRSARFAFGERTLRVRVARYVFERLRRLSMRRRLGPALLWQRMARPS